MAGTDGQEPMAMIFSNGVIEGSSTFLVKNMYDCDLIYDFSDKRLNKNFLRPRNLGALFQVLKTANKLLTRMKGVYHEHRPFGDSHFAMLPCALGSSAVRYKLAPRQKGIPLTGTIDEKESLAPQVENMVLKALELEESMAYDFCIQIAIFDGTPGPIRCVEEGNCSWDSPWHKVGILNLKTGIAIESIENQWGPRTHWPQILHFSPAHAPPSGLPHHRPVGQSGRLRRYLYEKRYHERVKHLYGRNACLFSAATIHEKTHPKEP